MGKKNNLKIECKETYLMPIWLFNPKHKPSYMETTEMPTENKIEQLENRVKESEEELKKIDDEDMRTDYSS